MSPANLTSIYANMIRGGNLPELNQKTKETVGDIHSALKSINI